MCLIVVLVWSLLRARGELVEGGKHSHIAGMLDRSYVSVSACGEPQGSVNAHQHA